MAGHCLYVGQTQSCFGVMFLLQPPSRGLALAKVIDLEGSTGRVCPDGPASLQTHLGETGPGHIRQDRSGSRPCRGLGEGAPSSPRPNLHSRLPLSIRSSPRAEITKVSTSQQADNQRGGRLGLCSGTAWPFRVRARPSSIPRSTPRCAQQYALPARGHGSAAMGALTGGRLLGQFFFILGTWTIFLYKKLPHKMGQGGTRALEGKKRGCRGLGGTHRAGEAQGWTERRRTHLVAADMEPAGAGVQLHDLADHGSHQRQGLRLVGVQGVREKCHFSEVSESLVLQHKLQRYRRGQEGTLGCRSLQLTRSKGWLQVPPKGAGGPGGACGWLMALLSGLPGPGEKSKSQAHSHSDVAATSLKCGG